jgi:hypothetical protein
VTDDDAEPDPIDAELIAYLDGELEPSAARALEDRLDADPKLRARAEGLKRSYDLLDFLPKPEPSPTFATRTMDKLPVSGPKPAVSSSSAVTMTPAPLSSLALAAPPRRGTPWAWAAGLLLVAGLALGAGYLGTAALRTHVFPPAEPREPGTDSLSVSEVRAIANLPLYAAVDDLDFLNQLTAPEFFGDELSPPEWLLPSQPLEVDKPTDPELQSLFRAFRELPAERQEKIRTLDQQIHALEPPKRDRMLRLLETYAAWLQRLPDSDRRDVLAANSSSKRIEAIHEVQVKKWIAGLPASQRAKLKDLPAEDKAQLLAKLRADEERSRTTWAEARLHWESLRTGKQPWPFADEKAKRDVLDHIRTVYRPDDSKRARLTASGPDGGDAGRLKEAMDRADKGEWSLLGKAVYDFSRKYEMLPEPAKGEPVLTFADLPPGIAKMLENKPKLRGLEQANGKWPEFALVVHNDLGPRLLAKQERLRSLGPCHPDDYRPEVRGALGELRKKATETEWAGLRALEHVWPNHPREMVRLARVHDVSIPGVLPPGPPSLWEKTYGTSRPMKPGG